MGAFNSAVITTKGTALLAKVVAGTCKLTFTKIAVSADTLSGDLASKTSIGTIKQSVAVASVVAQNSSNVKVSASINNESLTAGYYVRNIGLYATDPSDGEILYSISTADETDAVADWMPPYNGVGASSLLINLVTAVSNASSVNVTVDPAAMATVAQITDLQEQVDDLKNFVGLETDDIYGVEVDFVNKTFTRLGAAENLTAGADFDEITPWARRRCIVAPDGNVLAYYGESLYTSSEGGLLGSNAIYTDLADNETSYEKGTPVYVMVEQPLFYVKAVPITAESDTANSIRGKMYTKARFYISPSPKNGFTPMKGFKDDNGIIQDKIYLAAYEASMYNKAEDIFYTDYGSTSPISSPYSAASSAYADSQLLTSCSGYQPVSGLYYNSTYWNTTRAGFRTMANRIGSGWQLHNVFAMSISQWLALIEYASFDVQTKIGKGMCSIADDGASNLSIATGGTSSLGNSSGIDPDGTNGTCAISYRGEENLWGNIWTWLDGINIHNSVDNNEFMVYVKEYGEMTDNSTDDYTALSFDVINGNGYVSRYGIDENFPELMIPKAHSGSSTLPVGAYYWNQNDGWRVARFGGTWSSGSSCGWYLDFGNSSSNRFRYVGGRLLYVPQTKVAAA